MRYAVVVEQTPHNFSAYVPDLLRCIAAAGTEEETLALLREAVDLHLEELRAVGETVPVPSTTVAFVEAR